MESVPPRGSGGFDFDVGIFDATSPTRYRVVVLTSLPRGDLIATWWPRWRVVASLARGDLVAHVSSLHVGLGRFERAARVYLGEVTTVFAGRIQIGVWIHAVADVSSGRGDRLRIEVFARERGFNTLRAIRLHAHTSHADSRGFTRSVVVQRDIDRNPDDRKTRRRMRHLLISLPKSSRRFCDTNLAQDLTGP